MWRKTNSCADFLANQGVNIITHVSIDNIPLALNMFLVRDRGIFAFDVSGPPNFHTHTHIYMGMFFQIQFNEVLSVTDS